MALAIKTGSSPSALRIILQGQEGVGKTTWAAGCPEVLFLTCEDGGGLLDYARVVCPTWVELVDAVKSINREGMPAGYTTIAIDTIDSFERLLWQHLCEIKNVDSVEQIEGGFGKGYKLSAEHIAFLLQGLDSIRTRQGVNVVLLAHVHVKAFNDPNGPAYDRYEMRVAKEAAGLLSSWADAQLFACFNVTVLKTGKKTRDNRSGVVDAGDMEKGKATKVERVIYTSKDAAFDAKNRHNLPDELPMDFAAFAKAIQWNSHRKPKVNEADPNAPHDASFTDEERKRFMAKLGDMGIDYEPLKAWCLAVGKPKPSALPQGRRDDLLTALAKPDIRAKLDAFTSGANAK